MYCSPTSTDTTRTRDPSVTSSHEQSASVTALATARFDLAADACYGYFSAQGYSALANVLSGSNSKNESVLGWQFCDNIDGELARASPATTTSGQLNVYPTPGLPSILASPSPYGQCNTVYYTRQTYDSSSTSALNNFDRMVLVCLRNFLWPRGTASLTLNRLCLPLVSLYFPTACSVDGVTGMS